MTLKWEFMRVSNQMFISTVVINIEHAVYNQAFENIYVNSIFKKTIIIIATLTLSYY